MKTYRIPVIWEMWGVYEVEAPNIEEAERIALDELPVPDKGHYIDDGMTVDKDSGLYGEIEQA